MAFRRHIRWAGVGACSVLLLIWVITVAPIGGKECVIEYVGSETWLTIAHGVIKTHGPLLPDTPKGWRWLRIRQPTSGSVVFRLGLTLPTITRSVDTLTTRDGRRDPDRKLPPAISLPIWFLLLFGLAPTLATFWRVRRFQVTHCSECYYNLTRNISGVCPECGTPIPEEVRKELAAKGPNANATS
jgi:hypothetical protein